jgi:putative membrane protein
MQGFLGTRADFWWDVTVTSETVVILALIIGAFYAVKPQGRKHQMAMMIGSVMVIAWLFLYFAQQAIAGITGFGGPDKVKYLIYLPVILFHSLVSTAAVVLTGFQLYNGFKTSRLEGNERVLVVKPHIHRRLGKVTLLCFFFSVITAYSIYAMLFIIYEPARTPVYSASESIGVITMIGILLLLMMSGVLYGMRRRMKKTSPAEG